MAYFFSVGTVMTQPVGWRGTLASRIGPGGELMTDPKRSAPALNVYSQRENPAIEAWFATRTASREGAFFLPYLHPGMQVLDVGCGPGSITLGLAEVVAPGEAVGIDLQPTQIEQARALAVERGVDNVRFEVAEAYRLPFPAQSFDAAFAHGVLMHLREPVRALVEIRRVLRSGESATKILVGIFSAP
jgi:SAM-dependent methyltransferase